MNKCDKATLAIDVIKSYLFDLKEVDKSSNKNNTDIRHDIQALTYAIELLSEYQNDAKDSDVHTTDSNKPSQDLNKVSQEEHDGCVNCMYEHLSGDEHPCKECKQNYTDKYKRKPVKTRGDVIRESNESLAEFISKSRISCLKCSERKNFNCDQNCRKHIAEYLNQPESEE